MGKELKIILFRNTDAFNKKNYFNVSVRVIHTFGQILMNSEGEGKTRHAPIHGSQRVGHPLVT